MAKSMNCPKCKSTNIQVLGERRKGFSVGKAIGGRLFTGEIGLRVGFAGKKENLKYFVKTVDAGEK